MTFWNKYHILIFFIILSKLKKLMKFNKWSRVRDFNIINTLIDVELYLQLW